jgi:hypothetical protein
MVDTELLNTLVKLAALGASGISIFAIFWIGWLLYRRADSGNLEEHKTLRYFMGMCLIVAIIAATAGIANAILDTSRMSELEAKLNEIQPPMKIVAHPSTIVEPKGTVCLTLIWVKSRRSDADIIYTWSAEAGAFEPSRTTKLAQAKWVAPEGILPTQIRINVEAMDARSLISLGKGEETRIGIISPSTTGQPGALSGNC